MDKKIEQLLETRGIVFREATALHIKDLDKATKKELHTLKSADSLYIKDTVTGKKESLELYNCFFDSVNIRQLKTTKHTLFVNCTFQNTKIKDCAFANATFLSCTFIDSYILDTNLYLGAFINCTGVERIELYNCNLIRTIFTTTMDIDDLEQNGCEIAEMQILDCDIVQKQELKKEELIEVIKNNMANLPCKENTEEELKMVRDIMKDKEYKAIKMGSAELQNICFNNCHFDAVELEIGVVLDATTDFIECTFSNMTISGSYQKVAFDKSSFSNVVFDGEFTRCNFARCHFNKVDVSESSMFYTSNFDLSNAYEVFEEQQKQFTDVLFYDPNVTKAEEAKSEDVEEDRISILLKEIYEEMKDKDTELQEKIHASEHIDEKEVSYNYVSNLSDKEYISFIGDMTVLRVSKEQVDTLSTSASDAEETRDGTTAII